MNNKLIELDKISFSRNGRRVLENVSFMINKGEFLGIVGPNGAGKTTLLKIILGLLKPESGKILIEGEDIGKYSSRELYRKFSFVPQENNLDFPMTVIETVLLGRIPHLNRFQLENETDYSLAREALISTDMENFSDRYANQLSMGEKQLVSIAKALAQETDFIFLDEPTSSLDISHTIKIMEILKGLTENGKTIISVIHDLNNAARFCDKVLVLDKGLIKGFGRVDDVFTEEIIEDSFSVKVNIQRSTNTNSLLIETRETKR